MQAKLTVALSESGVGGHQTDVDGALQDGRGRRRPVALDPRAVAAHSRRRKPPKRTGPWQLLGYTVVPNSDSRPPGPAGPTRATEADCLMLLSVVIPCYNERDTIATVVAAVSAAPPADK